MINIIAIHLYTDIDQPIPIFGHYIDIGNIGKTKTKISILGSTHLHLQNKNCQLQNILSTGKKCVIDKSSKNSQK